MPNGVPLVTVDSSAGHWFGGWSRATLASMLAERSVDKEGRWNRYGSQNKIENQAGQAESEGEAVNQEQTTVV